MGVLIHRPKAVELALLQAGYTLRDLRGETRVHTTEAPPSGAAAVLGSVQQREARGAAVGALTLGLFSALETGLLSLLAASAALAVALLLVGRYDPEATEVQHEVQVPAMGHHEVHQRLVQWTEWKRLEKEAAEENAPSTSDVPSPQGRTPRRH